MPPTFMPNFQWTLLRKPSIAKNVFIRDYHPLRLCFPTCFELISGNLRTINHISTTLLQQIQFDLFCFHSPLLTKSHLISFPPSTKMFQFLGWCFRLANIWEVPFRYLGFKGSVLLPQAYRSLPRPSSLYKPSHPHNRLIRNDFIFFE